MKLSLPSLCRGLVLTAFALVTLTAASAASSFEGRVHMDMIAGKKKDKIGLDYTMKNGLLRMDMQMPEERHGRSGGMGMIYDMEAHEMIILMDMSGRKMFMRRPIPQPNAEQLAKGREAAAGHKVSAPEPTGRTEIIAGYKATEYRMTSEKGETIEMWLAKGLGVFMPFSGGNPMAGRGAPPAGWENFVREGNTFPMRVVTHDTSGAETMRMEVTSVDKGPVSDALFSTDGYSEFSFPGGMNPFKQN